MAEEKGGNKGRDEGDAGCILVDFGVLSGKSEDLGTGESLVVMSVSP